jgi:hypothetical protein
MKRYLLLLPLFVCLAACGSSPAPSTQTPSPTPTGPHRVDQVVTVPGWQITIVSAKTASTIGLMAPAQHTDTFLILQVTLRNISRVEATAADTSFYCLGADGTKYALVFVEGTPSIDGQVAAGQAASGQVTYEVPNNAKQFTLQYRSDAGEVLATWQLPA